MIEQAEKWPVDFDRLDKGDIISAEQLEKILGLPQTHQHYSVKLLSWKTWFETQMEQRGKFVVTRTDHGALRILTDAEAAAWLPDRFDSGLNISKRAHRKMLQVDIHKLTHLEQAELSYQRTRQAMLLGAVNKANKIAIKQRPKGIEKAAGQDGQ